MWVYDVQILIQKVFYYVIQLSGISPDKLLAKFSVAVYAIQSSVYCDRIQCVYLFLRTLSRTT